MLVPGYQQDHAGFNYQLHIDDKTSAQTRVPVEVESKPFSMYLARGEGGHRWHWTGQKMHVDACNHQATCLVCGPKHGAYTVDEVKP